MKFEDAVNRLVAKGFERTVAEKAVRSQFSDVFVQATTAADRDSVRRSMNHTEARRALELDVLQRTGVIRSWAYEAITLKLADGCRYTPDFLVVHNDGALLFEETKGFWRDDARVKIKVAARLFPMFRFAALTVRKLRDGGGWNREEIRP